MKTHSIVSWLSPLLLLGSVACDEPVAPDMANFLDGGISLTATIQGYSYDPEAFWFTLATCPVQPAPPPGQCPLPPIIVPNTPIWEASKMTGAFVGLFDPAQPTQTNPLPFMAPGPTDPQTAGWTIENVPVRPGPPLFPVAFKPPSMGDGGTTSGNVPPANYFPTFTFKPISTANTTLCFSQEAAVLGDSGILEAVAKHRNLPAAGALLDPSVAGGVIVTWLYLAQDAIVRVPAFGAYTTASAGTTYDIWWAPPGALPAFLKQSRRGFFVNTSGPPMPGQQGPIGVNVTVLPPLTGPPSPVTLTFNDPVTDDKSGNPALAGRPFTFPPIPPFAPAPGIITYIGLLGNRPTAPPPPAWVCLPN
jgi:hypothetical protein